MDLAAAGALALGAAGGWWVGDQSARENITATKDGVRAAAVLWVELMRWNDPRASRSVCRDLAEVLMKDGRRACRVPFCVKRVPSVAKP